MVRFARVYDERTDETPRVLVDRLWPRGVAKGSGAFDEWLRDVAPSHELRRWYGHVADRFPEFAERYRAELETEPAASALARLRELAAGGEVTLVTSTKELELSHLAVLAEELPAG